ncbi:hypothetical protein [Kushneria avicenniae]|uniref:hypothetical protein n=1 Tax=Kushneria avicenniae TaxID=402385 RepID=UPI00158737ED|nr:hypothetical protein [Kushneria avicenniae]
MSPISEAMMAAGLSAGGNRLNASSNDGAAEEHCSSIGAPHDSAMAIRYRRVT